MLYLITCVKVQWDASRRLYYLNFLTIYFFVMHLTRDQKHNNNTNRIGAYLVSDIDRS